MRPVATKPLIVTACFFIASAWPADAQEWSGRIGAQVRGFVQSTSAPPADRAAVSLSLEPEYQGEWDGGTVRIVPFLRLDSSDSERTHVDLRELIWRRAGDAWDVRAGVGKVFWGAVESVHLVDVVNQTDLVENIDGEDKLGQPMLALALVRGLASLELFVLPGFRPRTFPGEDGRPRLPLRVATELRAFESGGTRRIDAAARGIASFRGWDVALSHFHGVGREPRLLPGVDRSGAAVLIPTYGLVDQTGLEVQGVTGGWLWKLEAISRAEAGGRFEAFAAGFEYTFGDVGASGFDLGILSEYLYDERGDSAPTPFTDDVFLGLRVELNDVQSTRLLAGAAVDREGGSILGSVEASRRLATRWTLEVEARLFIDVSPRDFLFGMRRDDYIQIDLSRYL